MDEGKRSIQDLIPPARSKPLRPVAETETRTESILPPNPRAVRGKRVGLFAVALGLIVLVIVTFGVASTLFHHASVVVTLKSYTVPVSGSFEASPTGTNLAFVTKTATETMSRTVASTGTTRVEEVASGTITVQNAYSSSAQKLVAATRFQTKDGRIYKIRTPLTVPGYTKTGSTIVPGTVTATVYADKAGDTYNLTGPVDFTLPGFQGSPQFTKITGHLAGSIDGGFVGEKAVVSDTVRSQTIRDLSNALTEKLTASLTASLGSDDLLLPESISITFVTAPDKPVSGGAEITVTGNAAAPVFSAAAVAKVIAREGSITYSGPLTIANPSDLSVSIAASKTPGNVVLSLSGNVVLVGSYDRSAFLASLAGKSRADTGTLLTSYPAIESMQISLYPFWMGSLPKDLHRITLTEKRAATP